MKLSIKYSTILAAFFTAQSTAFASSTSVSDIKDDNIICYHMTKSEALVFKTTAPQKVWKTTVDREARVKTVKALQLGQSEIKSANSTKLAESFTAKITDGYQISGQFEANSQNELSLSVNSTYLPEGTTNSFMDHYNCSVKSSRLASN